MLMDCRRLGPQKYDGGKEDGQRKKRKRSLVKKRFVTESSVNGHEGRESNCLTRSSGLLTSE